MAPNRPKEMNRAKAKRSGFCLETRLAGHHEVMVIRGSKPAYQYGRECGHGD